MTKKLFWRDKEFLKSMASIAIPVAIQFLISTSINMADTVMISSLGATEIAAVGLVNQYVFFFMVSIFGFCSAGAVFFSQYYGDKDMLNVRRYLAITIQLTILVSLVFTVISLLFPYEIMRILIPDELVIEQGVGYLKLIALTFFVFAISTSFNTVLRSCNRAKEPLLVSFISFITNVFFNYMFIFGKFGAPQLGVVGAAIGTIIARFVEVILLTVMVVRKRPGVDSLRPIELFRPHRKRIAVFFKIALPIVIAEVLWSLGQLMFAMAYARIGKDATASIQLTNTIQNIFFIFANAVSSAAAVLIGHSLGSSNKEYASLQAIYFLQITTIFGVISSLILILAPDFLLKIYGGLEENIYDTAHKLLIIRGIFIPFRFLNGMLFVGILRAGGETKLPLKIEMITMWVFAIPMSFIGVLLFKWPIEWIFTIVSLEEFIKFFIIYPIYKKKRWLNNITQEGS